MRDRRGRTAPAGDEPGRERVTEVMHAHVAPLAIGANPADEPAKMLVHEMPVERATAARNEEVLAERAEPLPRPLVTCEGAHRARMQRQQPFRAELGPRHQQRAGPGVEIRAAQPHRFADPQTAASDEPEQRRVGLRGKRRAPR